MDFTGIKPYSPENVSVPDTYYSLGEDCIVIHKYIPSHLESGYIRLSQDRLPAGEIVFLFENYYDGTLALLTDSEDKLPDVTVKIDHDEIEPAINHGYILIGGPFDAGSRVILSQPPVKQDYADETPQNTDNIEKISDPVEVSRIENAADEAPFVGSTAEDILPESIPATDDSAIEAVSEETSSVDDSAAEVVPEEISYIENGSEETQNPVIADTETPADVISDKNSVTESISDEIESPLDSYSPENNIMFSTDTDTDSDDDFDTDSVEDTDTDSDEDFETDSVEDTDTDSDEEMDSDSDEDIDSDEDVAAETDEETNEGTVSGISALPAYSHTYENASILVSEAKQRYVLKIAEGAGAHAILPGGVEVFARSDGHAFKGYRMRIGEKEYDLVVMNVSELSEKAPRCNAYMKTLGSFSGDCCYCIDIAHPEKNGTHGVRKGSAYIDCETGYKWGMTTPGCYEFELENGNYNVYTITRSSDGNTFSDKASRKVSNGYLTLYSEGEVFTHISITAADAVISESSTYEWLTPDEKVLEAAYLYVPNEISVDAVNRSGEDKSESDKAVSESNKELSESANAAANAVPFSPLIDTLVANDTRVASKPDKTLKEPQFEHIGTGRSSESSDKPVVSPYVFDVLETSDKHSIDKKSTMENEMPTNDDHGIAEIRAAHTAEHTEGEVAAILLTHTDAAEAAINESTDENSKSARSAEQLGEKNPVSNNIRISTYSVTVPVAKKKNAEHLSNSLKTKKAKNAAAAAGIAAGAALLGGIIKALTGRKK